MRQLNKDKKICLDEYFSSAEKFFKEKYLSPTDIKYTQTSLHSHELQEKLEILKKIY